MLINLIEMDLIVLLQFITVGLLAYISYVITPKKGGKR